MKPKVNRRQFLQATTVAGANLSLGLSPASAGKAPAHPKPAALGGPKAHPGSFPAWPRIDEREHKLLTEVLHSGKWYRGFGTKVAEFEKAFAQITGAKHAIATSCGTTALLTCLGALDLGPGDEVILPPYTFVATYNVIVLYHALPVFVDIDPDTFQIDTRKIEPAITDRTAAILPVHIGGNVADMDCVLEAASQRKIPVIEDACQAQLAEWHHKVVGNWGLAGCFSFQASKNLTSGEGGALITNDDAFAERCFNFHNQGRGQQDAPRPPAGSGIRGANFRLTEFQGALLLAQMTRLQDQVRLRDANATYLAKLLQDIPGIQPARWHDGATRSANHLFMFRYRAEAFAGLSRARFLEALAREGIHGSGGYGVLNQDDYVTALVRNRHYQRIYSAQTLAAWAERNRCPHSEQLCREAVWFSQTYLLGTRTDMEQIADAIRKIQRYAADLARA